MRYLVYIALFAALALGGCGKKDENKSQPAPTEPAKPAEPVKPAEPETPPAAAEPDLTTEQDFEEEAQKEITDKNLEKQLKEIEGELGE